jgi:hypothetical protein
MAVKTLVLTSRNKVSGVEGDCVVDVMDRTLLENNKKYKCKLKWIHLSSPTAVTSIKTMFFTIDGLYHDDTYYNGSGLVPFAVIDVSKWSDPLADIVYEPLDHLRVVRVNQSVLRVKFFDAETFSYAGQLIDEWVMELQFIEIDE